MNLVFIFMDTTLESWKPNIFKNVQSMISVCMLDVCIGLLLVNMLSFRQTLRRINPMLFAVIEKEIKNLFNVKIIITLRFSKWVNNLVPVRK